jgi:hypothetical protein
MNDMKCHAYDCNANACVTPECYMLIPDLMIGWAFTWFFDVGSALRFLDCAFYHTSHVFYVYDLQNTKSPIHVEICQL